jgi:tRNA(Ile)-lysidine synthase
MVVREASRLGLAARTLRWEDNKPAAGLQAAAREARYRLMGAAMEEDGVDVLVTAHHAQDQAETVLMRLAHGSGPSGLAGMRPLSRLNGVLVARPLLGVDPAELRAVLESAALTPAADPSNDNEDYERVRWRRLLPRLSRLGLSPQRLHRLAERMQDVEAVLSDVGAAAFAEAVTLTHPGQASIDHVKFMSLNRAIALRVLSRTLGDIGGWAKPYALSQIEGLCSELGKGSIRPTTLHGCVVASDGRTITVRREAGRGPQQAARQRRLKQDAH